MVGIRELLKVMVDMGASDLHITSGAPPQVRIDGEVKALQHPPFQSQDTKQLCYSLLTDAQKRKFEEENELDLSFGVKGLARFRGNIYLQRGAVAGAFRMIPYKFMSFEELGLPTVVRDISRKPRGLVLVTGPTGSGKSTTLASIIDAINMERQEHIITIEDPIEYIHPHKKCLVNQREVGSDTHSFKKALKYILRQDPDVVLLGELRDLETIEAALTIAETGHLCFATLHTNSCVQTINRIVDVFPTNQQTQVRTQLSFVLEGVLSQTLIPNAQGKGRVLALEVMVPNVAIRALIRDDKVHQIYSQMQMGQEKYGMQTLNQSLFMLYHKKLISLEDALLRSSEPDELKQMIANPAAVLRRQVTVQK
ncbi:MAG: type IV pili twitching motility protein PilT [Desulfuromonadales bacterium C00003094]|jgi:twitching motility protein PilT|nr:MAG: type IV pili twitching motility protein PilT [Desulfuromonadales bacterium C00003094]OEU72072.1 MAG: type IV pili twitching motility protein PilT [Desulfuromonadales bacterium C00003107]